MSRAMLAECCFATTSLLPLGSTTYYSTTLHFIHYVDVQCTIRLDPVLVAVAVAVAVVVFYNHTNERGRDCSALPSSVHHTPLG
jgi:hypothetical protein